MDYQRDQVTAGHELFRQQFKDEDPKNNRLLRLIRSRCPRVITRCGVKDASTEIAHCCLLLNRHQVIILTHQFIEFEIVGARVYVDAIDYQCCRIHRHLHPKTLIKNSETRKIKVDKSHSAYYVKRAMCNLDTFKMFK